MKGDNEVIDHLHDPLAGELTAIDQYFAHSRMTEEDHAHWLEQQLGLIDRIGLQNYLQSQMSV